MIKRKDGSYSQRGLWDNIRANRGSGKKPTTEMLKQERKIRAKGQEGMLVEPPMTYTTVKRGEYKGRIFADRELDPLYRQQQMNAIRDRARSGLIDRNQKQASMDSITTLNQMRNPNIITSKPIKAKGICTPEEIKNGNCRNRDKIHKDAESGYGNMQKGGSLYKLYMANGGTIRRTIKGPNANYRPTESGAGMTAKGVAAYRRANPGSKLQTAVTGKVKPGSKAANRRKSYCARSLGQLKRSSQKTQNDPNSRIRQARRRWKC